MLPPSASEPVVPSDFSPFGRWFSAAFTLFGRQASVWLLQGLIAFACCVLPVMVVYLVMVAGLVFSMPHGAGSPPTAFVAGFVVVYLVLVFTMLLLIVYFMAGMIRTALKQLRGETIAVTDIFSGGADYGSLFGVQFFSGLLTMLGAVFCYIPGLIVGGLYMLAAPAVVDRRLGTMDALRYSAAIGRQNILLFSLFFFVLMLIMGTFFIVTFPIYILLTTVAYYDLTYGLPADDGTPRPAGFMPPTPPYQPPPGE